MRKGVVIAGAVVLLIGVAALGVGLYFLVDQSGLANIAPSTPKTTVVLAPGASANIGTTQTGEITIVGYSDNASAALQVSSGGSTPVTRSGTSGGQAIFVTAFVTLSGSSSSVVMANDLTAPVTVQYSVVTSTLGAIAYAGLLVLAGFVLAVLGAIILVVGVVLKKRQVPAPTGTVPYPSAPPTLQ